MSRPVLLDMRLTDTHGKRWRVVAVNRVANEVTLQPDGDRTAPTWDMWCDLNVPRDWTAEP